MTLNHDKYICLIRLLKIPIVSLACIYVMHNFKQKYILTQSLVLEQRNKLVTNEKFIHYEKLQRT